MLKTYYSPVPDLRGMPAEIWSNPDPMRGIAFATWTTTNFWGKSSLKRSRSLFRTRRLMPNIAMVSTTTPFLSQTLACCSQWYGG